MSARKLNMAGQQRNEPLTTQKLAEVLIKKGVLTHEDLSRPTKKKAANQRGTEQT